MATIVQISDLHFGSEDPALVEALSESIAEISPDAVAVCGDLTQKGKRREFLAAAEFLAALDAPVVIAEGNHDTPFWNMFARMTAPFARFRKRLARARTEAFLDDRLVMHTLNTARGVQARPDWSLGSVRLREAQEVIDQLNQGHKDAAKAVVCHHPLITPRNAPFPARTKRGEAAARILAEGGVDLVLTGHLHVEFAERFPFHDMTSWAVGAGTALSTRTRGVPAGFNAIRILPEAFELTVYHSVGAAFEAVRDEKLARRP